MGDFEAQTNQVNFYCLRSSGHAHITENNGFYQSAASKRPESLPFSLSASLRNSGVLLFQ